MLYKNRKLRVYRSANTIDSVSLYRDKITTPAVCINIDKITVYAPLVLSESKIYYEKSGLRVKYKDVTYCVPLSFGPTDLTLFCQKEYASSYNHMTAVPESFNTYTADVVSFRSCFQGCISITSVPKLDFTSATDAAYCFAGCNALTTIPEINTSGVKDMSYMISNCDSLINLGWEIDLSSCTNCTNMFAGTQKITGIVFKNVPADLNNEGLIKDIGLKGNQYTVRNWV